MKKILILLLFISISCNKAEDSFDIKAVASVNNGNKWYYIDSQGNPIKLHQNWRYLNNYSRNITTPDDSDCLNCGYSEDVYNFGICNINGCTPFAIENKGKYGYKNEKLEYFIKPTFKKAYDFSEKLAAVEINNKIGFINYDGILVISSKFFKPPSVLNPMFSGGLAAVANEKGKVGFIDEKGNLSIPYQFDDAYNFSKNGLAAAKIDKWGFINKSGEIVIKMQFDSIIDTDSKSQYGIFIKNDDKWGFISNKGELILKTIFDTVYSFEEFVIAEKDGKSFIYTKDGSLISVFNSIEIKQNIMTYSDNNNSMIGIIGADGKPITSVIYDDIIVIQNNKILVNIDNKWGILDEHGNIIIDVKYDYLSNVPISETISSDVFYFVLDGKKGLLNCNNNIIINGVEDTGVFVNNFASVKIDGKWGFIDSNGKIAVPPKFQSVLPFNKFMLAAVKNNDKWGLINYKGEWIIESQFDSIVTVNDMPVTFVYGHTRPLEDNRKYKPDKYFINGYAIVSKNGKQGYLKENGKQIIPIIYDSAKFFSHNSLAAVKLETKWGFIDDNGTFVIEPKYTNVKSFVGLKK